MVFYSFVNYRKSIYIFIATTFAIPFNWAINETFYLYINFGSFKLGIQELMFVYLLLLYFIYVIKYKKQIMGDKKIFTINIIWVCILAVYTFIGLSNNPLNYVFNDLTSLMYYLLIFLFLNFIFKMKDLEGLLKVIILASIVFSIVDIIIYLFKDSVFRTVLEATQWVDANRIGFTNSLLLVLLIPIALNFKSFLGKSKWSLYSKIAVALLFITVFFGKSVNVIVSVSFVLFFSIITKSIVEQNKLTKTKIISWITVVCTVLVISVILVYSPSINYESEFSNKIIMAVNDPTQLTSWQSRLITNKYAFEEFKQNIMGFGLGKTFLTFIQTGEIAQVNALFVDNTLYTVLNKIGILGTLFYFFYLLIIMIVLLKNAASVRQRYKAIMYGLCGSYISLLISMVSTSQLFRSPLVIIILQLIIISSSVITKENKIT
jgi:hypothetical protein